MSGWAIVNRIGRHGVEILTSEGRHFCITAETWERWSAEAWRTVWDQVVQGEGGRP